MNIKKIFVAVELWEDAKLELAQRAVDAAAGLAGDAELVIGAVAPPTRPIVGFDLTGEIHQVLSDIRSQEMKLGEERLNQLKDSVQGASSVSTVLIDRPENAVAKNIVLAATEKGADLIAITTHGRKGIARAVLGSVAAKVSHESPIPVLLLPPEKKA